MTTPITVSPIQANSVMLYLSVGRLRTRRKLATSAVDTNDIDPTLLRISKEIISSNELKQIAEHDCAVRAFVNARALESPFKGKGIMLLPTRLIEDVMSKIDSSQVERLALIESFMAAYERCKTEAEAKLGSAFDARDYPSDDEVRKTFYFECRMWELSAPGKLKSVSKELYQRELVKMENMWAEASRTVTGVLLDEFRKMTAHMVERLTPSTDGKAKIFRDSVVANMLEWMELFKARNLTNDADLVDVVDRAKELISGLDAKTVRDNTGLRKQLATDFQGLTDRLDEAIIAAPVRAIDLDMEDAAV